MVSERELATLLAALRFWQRHFTGGECPLKERLPVGERDSLTGICTDGDRIEPLDGDEIDALCERLNVACGPDDSKTITVVVERGCCTDVVGLPPGWRCEIDDRDLPQSGEPVDEPSVRFRNFYECTICDHSWHMDWSCTCDDKCPICNTANTPTHSEDLNTDGSLSCRPER